MSSQVAEQESPGPPGGSYLFQAPIRVNPSSADPVTQQIQRRLGDFQRVKKFFNQSDNTVLIGVDGAPPPSPGGPLAAAAASSSSLMAAAAASAGGRHMPPSAGQASGGATSRLQPSPDSRTSTPSGGGEFKKPHHQPHHHHGGNHAPPQPHQPHHMPHHSAHHHPHHPSVQQRGGYVKPADGKPPYGGRGGYPGQPVKHGSAGTASHRVNGVVPAKGPPIGGVMGLGGGLPEVSSGRALAERHSSVAAYDQNQGPTVGQREPLPSATPVADVDNIFKEMIVCTPLAAMAATPRIELDNKYTFNPVLDKLPMANPSSAAIRKRERPPQTRQPTLLRDDLKLSEESDDEQKVDPILPSSNITVGRMLSPLGATPAIHNSRSALDLNGGSLPQVINSVYAPTPIIQPPPPTSSSESGSESGSESDTTSDDSAEENVTSAGASRLQPTPAEPASTFTKPEEESGLRWNLASFCHPNDQSPVKPAPPICTSPDSRKRATEESESSDSTKDTDDRVVEEALAAYGTSLPLISSFSESESDQGAENHHSQSAVQNQQQQPLTTTSTPQLIRPNTLDSDSDSDSDSEVEAERTKVVKPVSRASPRTKSAASDSEEEVIPPVTVEKVINVVPEKVPDKVTKPGRGRPRKNPIVNGEEKVSKKRGRKPKQPKVVNGETDEDVKEVRKGKRGRPPKHLKPPPIETSSSDDENNDQRHKAKFEKPALPVSMRRRTKSKLTTATSSSDDSSDDDSDGPFPRRRKRKSSSSSKSYLERESLKQQEATSKKSSRHKISKSEERKQRRSKKGSDSDDDWNAAQKTAMKNRSKEERRKSESTTAPKKKDGASSPTRRKGRLSSSKKHLEPKSAEYVPSSVDSSSDSDTVETRAKSKVNASRTSSEESLKRMCDSDSDFDNSSKKTPKIIDTDIKVDENKAVADKNKNDTLRKLFTPKRDSEGGKGGGKAGGKGGKGKGGVNVIIVDGDYERSSSSIEDEVVPMAISNPTITTEPTPSKKDPSPRNPTPFSPTPIKKDDPSVKPDKTEPVTPVEKVKSDEHKRIPLWVKIDLDKLNLKAIPTIRQRYEQKMPWLFQSKVTESVKVKEDKKAHNEDSKPKINERETECELTKKSQGASEDHADRGHKSKKRKRKNSSSSVSSHSTVSNMSEQSKKKDHHYSHHSQHSKNKDKDDNLKSKRRKEEGNQPQDTTDIEDDRDVVEVPCSRSQSQTENLSLTDAPPTNHERVPLIGEQQHLMLDMIRGPSCSMDTMPVVPVPQVGRNFGAGPSTFVRREYHSYFEPSEGLMDLEISDQSQYLMEATRMKEAAEREPDPIKQCMLYLEAVQYFLLTSHVMESELFTENAAFTMYRNTLTLIQHIALTFRKPQNTSPVFHKLAVLSYRCQALLFYKLFTMRKQEAKEVQKQIGEYCNKHLALQNPAAVGGPAPIAEHHVHPQGQGTPSPLSPTPSPGSVGSVGSQSSGYTSGGAQPAPGGAGVVAGSRDAGAWVPFPVCNAMAKMHHQFGYLISFQELWDVADNLVIKGNYTDFFIELDRYCKPLTMHSSIIDVVRYVREGIRRLRCAS